MSKNKPCKKVKKEKAVAAAASSSGGAARRPFDRDTDLQVNRFDEAAKAAMLKKARKMDERFVSGQSKFIWKWNMKLTTCTYSFFEPLKKSARV